MADLMADRATGGVATPPSVGNGDLPARPRTAGAPNPTGSPSGIRGPRMIMQERAAREAARQKAEQEQMQLERQRAEQEARRLEDRQRRNSERRTAGTSNAAGGGYPTGAAAGAGALPEQQYSQPQQSQQPSYQQQQPQQHHYANQQQQQQAQRQPEQPSNPQRRPTTTDTVQSRPSGASRRQDSTTTSRAHNQQRAARHAASQQAQQASQQAAPAPVPTPSQPQPQQVPQASATAGATQQQQVPQGTLSTQPSGQGAGNGAGSSSGVKARNAFPHAFERWETLSAHWEGLTNFWIRRLEQNNEDIDRDPINQALSRQVTDLSAAGANLFHAVVELQRLRASSERKFQRWFFETRAELERSQEVTAMLENAINEERRAREEAIAEAVAKEQANSMSQTRFEELRKELQISKEEARRAWEELGRREQEERERTMSLQSGQPTIVGGVQVVPMMQTIPPRDTSAAQGGYSADYARASSPQSPTDPVPRSAAESGGYYTQQSGAMQEGAPSEGGYSDEGDYQIDAQGNYVRDHHGNKVNAPPSPVSEDYPEDYETPTTTNPPSAAGYSQAQHPQMPAQQNQSGQHYQQQQQQQRDPQYQSQPQDYSGQGYAAPGWETVPRHHHPTRLSDVLEEDERSRTSAGHSRV